MALTLGAIGATEKTPFQIVSCTRPCGRWDNSGVLRGARLLAVLLLAVGLATVPAPPAPAAVGGDLDRSFSSDGKYLHRTGITGRSVAVQDDGKIVVVGDSGYWGWVLRFLPNGALDTTFGDDGEVNLDFGSPAQLHDVAIQSNGRIVVVGRVAGEADDYNNTAIARLTTSGALDTTFRGDGISALDLGYREYAHAVAIAPDGKIVLVGQSLVALDWDFMVARFTTSGGLDGTFSSDGKTTTGFGGENDVAFDVAVQSDGKIVAAGRTDDDAEFDYDFAVARYRTSGSLDSGFNFDGKASTGFGYSDQAKGVAIQADGRIVVAGSSNGELSDFAVARYTTSGFPDERWDGDGKLTTGFGGTDDWAEDVAIQDDGRIVVAGKVRTDSTGGSFDFGLARYNSSSGSLSTSFSTDGKVRTGLGYSDSAYAMAIQEDGKILAAGESFDGADYRIAMVRYHSAIDTPPNTAIDSGPSGATTDTTPTFAFHATEAGTTFECTLGTTFAPCTSPKTYSTLAQGSYTFKVRATDRSAQTDTTPAARSFVVDTRPNTTITSGPSGPTGDSTPTFAFTATEPSTFACSVDEAAYAACTSPFTLPVQTDGPHTLRVLATDTDGTPNTETTPASRSFTVDTVAPDTVIDAGPPATTTDTTPTFEFHATDPTAVVRCRIDSGPTYACVSPWTSPKLALGSHVASIWAVDPAANADATPATWSFEVVATG